MKSMWATFLGLALVAAASAGNPSGKWTWKAEGAQGRSIQSTLSLQWTEPTLTGSIENQLGTVEISSAGFRNDQVTFTVVRKVRRREVVVHYEGKLEGDRIVGTIRTRGRGGKDVALPWNASRVP